MADASNLQTSFLGGEWSPNAQGRAEHPSYKTAMAICFNGYPVEEGAWTRRPGFLHAATTLNGAYGRTLPWVALDSTPYEVELTAENLRVFAGRNLALTIDPCNLVSVTSATPSVFTFDGTGVWSSATNYTSGQVAQSTVDSKFYIANMVNTNTEPSANHGSGGPWQSWWSSGDQVEFLFGVVSPVTDGVQLRNRQLVIAFTSATTFTLTDPIDGTQVGGIVWNPTTDNATIARVMVLPTPYSSTDIEAVRAIPAASAGPNQSDVFLMLHDGYVPQALFSTPNNCNPRLSPFSIQDAAFADGPYLDPIPGATLSASALGPTVTLTLNYQVWSAVQPYTQGTYVTYSGQAYILSALASVGQEPDTNPTVWTLVTAGSAVNNGKGFLATDIGRSIRLFSEPPAYIPDSQLPSAGAWGGLTQITVAYPGNGDPSTVYYQNTSGDYGLGTPGSNFSWTLTAGANVAAWTWGTISAINSPTSVTVTLMGGDLLYDASDSIVIGAESGLIGQQHTPPSLPVIGSAPSVIMVWRLGVYSETTGYPTCGAFYEGRLWLGGVIRNRFDSSMSNQFFNFSPTSADGTVGDANGITASANDIGNDEFQWMSPLGERLLSGTKTGVWNISASQLNDPITPSDVQAHKVVRIGSAITPPVNTPLTAVFVEPFGRQMYELFQDVFTQKLTTPNLNVFSKHMTATSVLEMAYQSEAAPIVWSRLGDGTFMGTTYRRVSAFAQEDPKFVGSHRHAHAGDFLIESVCEVPTPDFTTETLNVVANDPSVTVAGSKLGPGVRHVEFLMPQQEPPPQNPTSDQLAAILASSNFLDDATTPAALLPDGGGVNLYGLYHLNGKTATALIGGLDCGDYVVAAGTIYVPFLSDPGKFFTQTFLTALLAGNGVPWGGLGVPLTETLGNAASSIDNLGGFNVIASGSTPVVYWLNPTGVAFIDSQLGSMYVGAWTGTYNGITIGSGLNFSGEPLTYSGTQPVVELTTLGVPAADVWSYGSHFSGGAPCSPPSLPGAGYQGSIPILVGLTYTSQGQRLRAMEPQEAGTQTGPALGKTRRTHMYGLLISAAVAGSLYVGTLFTKLAPVIFKQKDNVTPYTTNTLFSGVHWGTLNDDYSFDSQFCWQITRPLPLTIAAAGNFLHTQER